jgi:hypothetical protein
LPLTHADSLELKYKGERTVIIKEIIAKNKKLLHNEHDSSALKLWTINNVDSYYFMTYMAIDDKIKANAINKFPNDYWSQQEYYENHSNKVLKVEPNSFEDGNFKKYRSKLLEETEAILKDEFKTMK